MGAPSGSAEVFPTGRVLAFLPGDLPGAPAAGDGSRVGNRVAALPPGLRLGLSAGIPGSVPTGSGEVTVSGSGGAVMLMATAALGSFWRWAALPMTVRLADLT